MRWIGMPRSAMRASHNHHTLLSADHFPSIQRRDKTNNGAYPRVMGGFTEVHGLCIKPLWLGLIVVMISLSKNRAVVHLKSLIFMAANSLSRYAPTRSQRRACSSWIFWSPSLLRMIEVRYWFKGQILAEACCSKMRHFSTYEKLLLSGLLLLFWKRSVQWPTRSIILSLYWASAYASCSVIASCLILPLPLGSTMHLAFSPCTGITSTSPVYEISSYRNLEFADQYNQM